MIKVYDYYQEENKALEERFTLASERIYEIQNEAELCAPYASYVTMVASFLSEITDTWNCVATGSVYHMPLEQLQQLNHSLLPIFFRNITQRVTRILTMPATYLGWKWDSFYVRYMRKCEAVSLMYLSSICST